MKRPAKVYDFNPYCGYQIMNREQMLAKIWNLEYEVDRLKTRVRYTQLQVSILILVTMGVILWK